MTCLAEGFGPGFNGPLMLAVDLSGTTSDDAALAAHRRRRWPPTPASQRSAPAVVGPSGDAAVIQVTPTTGPQDEATTQLVNRLRERRVAPASSPGTGAPVLRRRVRRRCSST